MKGFFLHTPLYCKTWKWKACLPESHCSSKLFLLSILQSLLYHLFSWFTFLPPNCYCHLQTMVISCHLFQIVCTFFPLLFLLVETFSDINTLVSWFPTSCVQQLISPFQSSLLLHLIITITSNSQDSSFLFWTPGSSPWANSSLYLWHFYFQL